METGASPAISIHDVGHVGATKSERAGISKLKSDMKLVSNQNSKQQEAEPHHTYKFLRTLLTALVLGNLNKSRSAVVRMSSVVSSCAAGG